MIVAKGVFMRIGLIILCLSSFSAFAQNNYGYLRPEDQKYFKNDSLDGKNKWERIDANVAEINRLHGTIAEMKLEIQKLKTEVEELKKKK
jgi:hypothetical protein